MVKVMTTHADYVAWFQKCMRSLGRSGDQLPADMEAVLETMRRQEKQSLGATVSAQAKSR